MVHVHELFGVQGTGEKLGRGNCANERCVQTMTHGQALDHVTEADLHRR